MLPLLRRLGSKMKAMQENPIVCYIFGIDTMSRYDQMSMVGTYSLINYHLRFMSGCSKNCNNDFIKLFWQRNVVDRHKIRNRYFEG